MDWLRGLVSRLRKADPGLLGLKTATRAAICIPAVFAFTHQVIGNAQMSLFGAFGSFAILVFADFGGTPRARLSAFLVLAAVGAIFIPLGTLCAKNPWLAGASMGVVAFAVLFSGLINGYFAAGATAAMLTYILPVSMPVSASVIDMCFSRSFASMRSFSRSSSCSCSRLIRSIDVRRAFSSAKSIGFVI